MESPVLYNVAPQRRIIELRTQLQEMRARALLATTYIAEHPLATDLEEELVRLMHLAETFRPDASPSMAVYLLGQIVYRVQQLLRPWTLRAEYAALQEKLRQFEEQ